jgi:hypothetical protein
MKPEEVTEAIEYSKGTILTSFEMLCKIHGVTKAATIVSNLLTDYVNMRAENIKANKRPAGASLH